MLPCEIYCCFMVSIFILSLVYYEHMKFKNLFSARILLDYTGYLVVYLGSLNSNREQKMTGLKGYRPV